MKVAVVGGGSTYTPELVDGFARLRHLLPVEELVLTDPNAGAAGRRRRSRRADPGQAGAPRPPGADDRPRPGAGRRLRRAAPAAGRRAGRPQRGRDAAAGVRLRRAGDHRGRWARQGAAHRAGRARHRRAGARAGPTTGAWIVDFTNPVGIVTRALLDAGHRAVGLCNVAIGNQRRVAEHLAVDPGRVDLDHVGLNHLTWDRAGAVDGVDVLPELLAERGPSSLTPSGLPLDLLRRLGGLAVVLPAVLLRARRRGRRAEGSARPGRQRSPRIERRAARPLRRPGAGREAGSARAARRRLLLRGRGQPGRLAGGRPRRRAGGQPPQQRHPAVPRRQRCDRGARPGRRHGGRPPSRSSRSTRCSPDWSRTCRRTRSSLSTPRSTAGATASTAPFSRTR